MRNICFVLDRSGSMEGERLECAKEGILGILEDLYVNGDRDKTDHNDHVSFITFDDVVKTRVSLQPLATGVPMLMAALERTYAGNMTALWDACGGAIKELSSGERNAEPWAIILTDGRDTASRRFGENSLKEYADKKDVDLRLLSIGIGDSVDKFKLQALSSHFQGQYIAAASDPRSIRGAFLHIARSMSTGKKLAPKIVIDVKKGVFGDLKKEDFTKNGMPPRKRAIEKEKRIVTDFAKMPLGLLKLNTPDAQVRKEKAMNEISDYEISGLGGFGGALVFRVANRSLNKTCYYKLEPRDSNSVYGACTCGDFYHRAGPLGIPCKHIWIALGVGDGEENGPKGKNERSSKAIIPVIEKRLAAIEDDLEAALISIIQKRIKPILHDLIIDTIRNGERPAGNDPIYSLGGRYFVEGILNNVQNSSGGLTGTQVCRIMGIKTSGGHKKAEVALRFLEEKKLVRKKGEKWFGAYHGSSIPVKRRENPTKR